MSAAHAVLSASAKVHRDHIWQILRIHYAPALWRPELIDIALNLVPPVASFTDICDRVARVDPRYAALTLSDLIHPTGELMGEWFDEETKRRVWGLDLQEEARSILVEITVEAIQTYTPSRQNSSGRWESQGFGAYLHLRSSGLYRRTRLAADACGTISLDSLLDPEAMSPDPGLVSIVRHDRELIRLLIEAVRASLDSAVKWDCFHAMTYLRRSLRDLAREQHIPKSNLSRQITRPIVSMLHTLLHPLVGSLPQLASGDLGAIAQAFGALLSVDEFAALIPRPQKVGHSPARREREVSTIHRKQANGLPNESRFSGGKDLPGQALL
jgi:hypothetical protein